MNPSNQQQGNYNLPSPLAPQALDNQSAGIVQPPQVASLPTQALQSPLPSISNPAVQSQSNQSSSQPLRQPGTNVAESHVSASSARSPKEADIDKEWVERAKKILENNKNDPHKQASDMDHFKADYMKKRYNKDVKVSED